MARAGLDNEEDAEEGGRGGAGRRENYEGRKRLKGRGKMAKWNGNDGI